MRMNQNRPTDSSGREEITIGASSITLDATLKLADGYAIAPEHPLPVAVVNGVEISFDGPQHVVVDNFPNDAANATNQLSSNGKLDTIITKLNAGLPNALIDGLLGVKESNSTLILANQANGTQKTKISNGTNEAAVINTSPSDPATEYGMVTRSIPSDLLIAKLNTMIGLLEDIKTNTTLGP